MRLFLEGAEVWSGLTFLGIVSAEWLATQIQERLAYIASTERLKADLAADPTRPLGPPAHDALPLPRKLPLFLPISKEVRQKRRDQRRRNKGRRAAS